MASGFAVLGLVSAVFSLVFNAIAISTPHWIHARGIPGMDIGVFRHCEVENGYCGDMEAINAIVDAREVGWFRAVQATFMLSVLGSLLATVLSLLIMIQFFENKGSYRTLVICSVMALSAEITSLILLGMDYHAMFNLPGYTVELAWSFYIAVAACVFLFLNIVFHSLEASRAAEVLRNMQHRLTVWTTPYTLFTNQDV